MIVYIEAGAPNAPPLTSIDADPLATLDPGAAAAAAAAAVRATGGLAANGNGSGANGAAPQQPVGATGS
jgi:hypothetical protein